MPWATVAGNVRLPLDLKRWPRAKATERGFARDEIMAVGDNLNDLEMLEFAGTAVVMGNATDEIKSRGYHVTGNNDENGLTEAITEQVLRRSRP